MVTKKFCFCGIYLFIYRKGFRHDYLNKYSFPTLNRIQNEGIKTTHGMQPTYTTMTFPNHISIATGRLKLVITYSHVGEI